MKKRKPIPFKVIVDNVNTKKFDFYDVMPYFIRCYEDTKDKQRDDDFKSIGYTTLRYTNEQVANRECRKNIVQKILSYKSK